MAPDASAIMETTGEKTCQRAESVWHLDALVLVWALASLLGWGYGHWVDLRWAGTLGVALEVAWSLSVAAITLARLRGHRLKNEWACWLPSFLMLVALALNSVRYWQLQASGRWQTGGALPLTLIGFLVLGGWVVRNRRSSGLSPTGASPRRHSLSLWHWGWILVCAAGAFWFFGLQFPPNDLPASAEPIDLAVVLGNHVLDDGTASRLLDDRVMGAVELYRTGRVRYIMLSGAMHAVEGNGQQTAANSGGNETTTESPKARVKGKMLSEAVAMEKVCLREGIPESALIVDPMGINTRATVVNTLSVMRQRGFKTVVGVSDDSHLLRIKRTFVAMGQPAYIYPASHDLWPVADPMAIVREMAGIVVYAVDPNYRITEAERMDVKLPRIVVKKGEKKLELFDGERLVKTYACISGRAAGDKEVEGDLKTPEGTFRICYKNPESKFHLSLGLDYPNIKDAERGLQAGLITQSEHDQIVEAVKSGGVPNWYTKLGGEIFIHGNGEGREGTLGCVAMKDNEVEELYAICDLGTVVEVRP